MLIKELDDNIVLITVTKNFNSFSNKILEYLKLKKRDLIVFVNNSSNNKLIENLIELNNFQNSINRVMVIVPKNEKEVNFHGKLNLIKSIQEGIDYILLEKIQREL